MVLHWRADESYTPSFGMWFPPSTVYRRAVELEDRKPKSLELDHCLDDSGFGLEP